MEGVNDLLNLIGFNVHVLPITKKGDEHSDTKAQKYAHHVFYDDYGCFDSRQEFDNCLCVCRFNVHAISIPSLLGFVNTLFALHYLYFDDFLTAADFASITSGMVAIDVEVLEPLVGKSLDSVRGITIGNEVASRGCHFKNDSVFSFHFVGKALSYRFIFHALFI